MKTGITANIARGGYDRWGEKKYEKLKEHGFSCIDYSMVDTDSALYQASEEEFEKMLKHEKDLADAAGIEVSQVHGPWRYPPRDLSEEDRAERLEKMKKSIKGTAILGCKYWVVHPIMPYTTVDLKEGKAQETWEMNLQFMRELLKTAKEYGITICLENMPMLKFSISTPKRILEFVNEINDENFKICFDTGHAAVFEGLSVGDSIRELGDKIKVLHVHDNHGTDDEHLNPYSGCIDWDDFKAALKEIGFDGAISLEVVMQGELPDADFEEKCIMLGKIAKSLAE